MYAKLIVQGPDAVKVLNHVCGAQMDVDQGVSVYTQFLNSNGGIEADVTVTRLAPTKFLVITGHPSQIRDRYYLETQADPSWQFEIFDATSAFSLLTIQGPKSRQILQALSSNDLSNGALPFGAAREIDIAYSRGWAIRRSFLGELGYELLLPTEFTASVYEALMEVGSACGLQHMGMFAMNACRLEKGFRHFGHDIGEDDTPFETGFGFSVDLGKENFLGREALVAQREQGIATKSRTVSIAVPELTAEDGPYLIHNEPIWKDGIKVGFVTSGGWGFRLKQMVGLASVSHLDGVSAQWVKTGGFTVQIAGQHYAADVQLRPFFDPNGIRMKA